MYNAGQSKLETCHSTTSSTTRHITALVVYSDGLLAVSEDLSFSLYHIFSSNTAVGNPTNPASSWLHNPSLSSPQSGGYRWSRIAWDAPLRIKFSSSHHEECFGGSMGQDPAFMTPRALLSRTEELRLLPGHPSQRSCRGGTQNHSTDVPLSLSVTNALHSSMSSELGTANVDFRVFLPIYPADRIAVLRLYTFIWHLSPLYTTPRRSGTIDASAVVLVVV
ncbi:hypothetical protein BKA70DRAFT_1317476 [Coprinopsis sp. MPI-PUGE-AT-0042]|nr:hypothetical protein BKA70DRAFT_1317476 [Coprinopsis sp. MPI-PUGE-AT-0042]